MNVSLSPELEQLIEEKVKSGMYNSASEVIRAGLRLLKEQDEIRQIRMRELKREVQIGMDEIERGEIVDGDEVFQELRERNLKAQKAKAKKK
ncbi:type II toxin-antitoxin system ParD family antitoxin [Candidatus Obscuribacterales bacterium]|nr:type II toxin-antitoxin system ParD family antitoxin [Candidatus Obscuribacterales bacterium]MBX3151780.1 type II toxin-antitoxin system ParD family antitoxin [Candidatus Obscuribacterales bacterium]